MTTQNSIGDYSDLPSSVKAAREAGSQYYFTGSPCRWGHVDRRRTRNKDCVSCEQQRLPTPEAAKARAAYLKAYYAANIDKAKIRSAAHYRANIDKIRTAHAAYRAENADKIRANNAEYRAKNPEKVRAASSAWWKEHPAKLREKNRRQRAANPEKFRAAGKARYAKTAEKCREYANNKRATDRAAYNQKARAWRNANCERSREVRKAWRATNRDSLRLNNQASRHKRRARVASCADHFTFKELKALWDRVPHRCANYACGKRLTLKTRHADHIEPIAGSNPNNSIRNIQFLCGPCNSSKGAKDPLDFMRSQGFLL